jgi:hypothetical protein
MADASIAFFGGLRLVLTPEQRDQQTQDRIDRFAAEHAPCCAGCDHWRWHNSVVGECLRTAPVAGIARVSMLGISATSAPLQSGHIMTPREHRCGEFQDNEQHMGNPA